MAQKAADYLRRDEPKGGGHSPAKNGGSQRWMNVAMVMMAPVAMIVAVIMTMIVMTGICGGGGLTGRVFVRVSVHRRDPYSTRSG
jgi:hypothetical protein